MACSKVITKFDESGSLVLNHDVLYEILTKLDKCKRPFAIISIAGQMRTGKSFLLNFFIRCLRMGGPKKCQWIGDGQTSVQGGVVWRRGAEPETKGIHIWDEIFTLTRENGEEISVILMDTQGLFDHDTVPGNTVKLFTLSTLASSVQILNVLRQITERDLEHLQLCVEYADAVAKQDLNHFKMQDLLVLVRDCPFEEDYQSGMEGGQEYLKSILANRENKSELNNVREDIKKSFERLDCFLMPHPGAKVVKRTFKGKNEELEQDFLERVEMFTNHLLDPDNLPLKTMNGKELGNFLMACDNSFISGQVPKVTNLLEASAKAFWSSRYEEGIESYMEILKSELQGFPKSEKQLNDMHKKAIDKVLQNFDEELKFTSSPNRQKYKKHLEDQCLEQCEIFRQKNAIKKNALERGIEETLKTSVEKYEENMNQACGTTSMESSKLEKLHKKYYSEALTSFEQLTKDYSAFAKGSERKLQTRLEKVYDSIKRENERKAKEEKLAKV